MHTIRISGLIGAAALAVAASSSASAATYLFTFQFDDLVSDRGNFAATSIVYSGDDLYDNTLTYVSGSVNGATAAGLFATIQGNPTGQRAYIFEPADYDVPVGGIADIFFSVIAPLAAETTHETTSAGRGIRTSSGASFRYTTGRLTITAVPEPSAWALMILGFGCVGAAMRRRRVRIAFA